MATKGQRHARIHQWERDTDAYQSLSCEARALLTEFRLLYTGRENRLFMSTREIMRRLNVGRTKAEKARDELLDRGFVRLITKGAFKQKTRNASVYALTNEPITQSDGDCAPKDYMRWTPKKITVPITNTDGAAHQHRELQEEPENPPHGAAHQHREPPISSTHGVDHQHTGSLPRGSGEAGLSAEAFAWLKTSVFMERGPQLAFCLATVALAQHRDLAA